MMKINRTIWITFVLLSLVSAAVWFRYSYPQLAISNFSIDRAKATAIAIDYLERERNVDTKDFYKAASFRIDSKTNRYIQRSIGFKGLEAFIEKNDFDMFYWLVRFFKETTKEEYVLEISSETGEVIGLAHAIDENAKRNEVEREEARKHAKSFLMGKFKIFDPDEYTLRSNFATTLDNRSDFVFSWQSKEVNIPWSDKPDSGTGKLVIRAIIAGDEVLSFAKNVFVVPDGFFRDLDYQKNMIQNILVIVQILVLALLTYGIFLIIIRQNHLAMHTTKKFYLKVVIFSFTLSLLGIFNQFESIMYSYRTTLPLRSYLWQSSINAIFHALFVTIAVLIPSLSGELLHYETSPNEKSGSFLYYIRSTFTSRHVGESIVLGYLICFIMLGMQTLIFQFGQTYLNVWMEHKWIDNISTAYLPFLAVFTFAFKASFSEEILYRLFTISLGQKIFNKFAPEGGKRFIFIIVILSSLLWGFAHSGYPVFPVWFRGLQVTCLGIFLGLVYLRFGFIPVLIGHFLFNTFWSSAGFIFGTSLPIYFYSCLSVLLLPLGFAIITFIMNTKKEESALRWHLNKHQCYNLEVLKTYLNANKEMFNEKSHEQIKREITPHGWDPAVVEVALEYFHPKPGTSRT